MTPPPTSSIGLQGFSPATSLPQDSDPLLDDETRALLERAPARGKTLLLTRTLEAILLLAFAAVPMFAIGYIVFFQDASLRVENHAFHEVAIGIAIIESALITYVTWRCYLSSGEPFLRWLTLSFLAFTLVYAPHGLFTRMADHNIWLFLFFGPVSRLLMALFLFVGLMTYGSSRHPRAQRQSASFWLGWAAAFLGVDLLIGWLTHAWPEVIPLSRLAIEYCALGLALSSLVILRINRPRSPLMLLYALALAFFAQSSFAFIIAKPWDHLWWLAHAISAGGFLLLGYGVLHAFRTTRSFSLVFSEEELITYLRAAKARADHAAQQLQEANEELARLAATDPLTGVANRRHFMERAEAELARARRAGSPMGLLALDIDHFKRINDTYGHETGDRVLQRFCTVTQEMLRPSDLLGRVGGEEFMILLPDAGKDESAGIAERIRAAIAKPPVPGTLPPVTTSIGIATHAADGDTLEALLRTADQRLYRAKDLGRNRVAADDATTGPA